MNNCLLLVPVFPGNDGVLIPGNPGIYENGRESRAAGKREPANENTTPDTLFGCRSTGFSLTLAT